MIYDEESDERDHIKEFKEDDLESDNQKLMKDIRQKIQNHLKVLIAKKQRE